MYYLAYPGDFVFFEKVLDIKNWNTTRDSSETNLILDCFVFFFHSSEIFLMLNSKIYVLRIAGIKLYYITGMYAYKYVLSRCLGIPNLLVIFLIKFIDNTYTPQVYHKTIIRV